jgi:DNA helicase-2/ATP-dependent DNA helicase PcrA
MAAAFIIRLREENPELFPVAVLYRINSQSLAFETAFAKRGINFKILKGIRFFDRKEVKDSVALLKLALNPHDDISFLRLVDFLPVGIGPKTLRELSSIAKKENLPLFTTLKTIMPEKFNAREIFTLLDSMNRRKDKLKLSDMLDTLLKRAGYREFLKSKGEQNRLLNIDELLDYLKNWEAANPGESFGLLLDRISLDSGDIENNGSGENETDVFMLTMHNAKGLEFPTIFAAGVNSSYMPFFLRKERVEIEEERRLFYVASTRAVKQLVVSVGAQKPSRFLSEVGRSLYSDVFSVDDLFGYLPSTARRPLPESGIEQETREERYLDHPIFGRGKIINAIDKDRYVVDFAEKGEKTIDTSIVPVTFL